MGLLDFFGRKIQHQRELEQLYDLGCVESGRSPGGYWRDSTLNRMSYVSIGRRVVEKEQARVERETKDRESRRPKKTEQQIRALLGQLAADNFFGPKYRQGKQGPREKEERMYNGLRVRTKSGYSVSTDSYTTDVIIIDPEDKSGKWHFVVDEYGEILVNEWHSNR